MSEWISVKDRMPTSDDFHIWIARKSGIEKAYFWCGKFVSVKNHKHVFTKKTITHWQPVIMPYDNPNVEK